MDNELLTLQEVATRFRTSEMTITRLIKNKELKAVRIHRLWRIYAESVEMYLEDHSNENLPDIIVGGSDLELDDTDDTGLPPADAA